MTHSDATAGLQVHQAEPRAAADAVAGERAPHDALLSPGDHLRTHRGTLRVSAPLIVLREWQI